MKIRFLLFTIVLFLGTLTQIFGQTTTCPAPIPGDANCYQTSRPSGGNPLTNWPPIPHQDCCNAIPLCQPVNFIDNGVVVPPGAPTGTLFPGCVQNELPPAANICFSNNEKATTWYKFQIRPLPGGPTAPGSPAGKLRFRIIPLDAYDDPTYDENNDLGAIGYGETDYDFLLFNVSGLSGNDGAMCTAIRNSSTFGTANSVVASCNWTGTRGPTGLFEPGTGTQNAVGPATRFNIPLSVKVGQVFYLAIDNFSVNQQGFYVKFTEHHPGDSTAIVNPPPTDSIRISSIINPICAQKQFTIRFDHPVICDSVKADKFLIQGLNPPYQITSIAPEGGCNPGGQDTSFVFTIQPDMPDTTLRLLLVQTIKDICGNSVLFDTARLRIEYPVPLVLNLSGSQPSCGITKLRIKFASLVLCDSVKANKFQIFNNGLPFGQVTEVVRANGLPCGPNGQDSVYVLTFSKAIIDSTHLQLLLSDIIKDKCGNPVELDTLDFRIDKFLNVKSDTNKACPGKFINYSAVLDSTFKDVQNEILEYTWRDVTFNKPLVEDGDTIIFTNDTRSKVKIKKDLFYPKVNTYRVYVLHKLNGCIDSSDISVLYSAKPDVRQIDKKAFCYKDSVIIRPTIANGTLNQFEYSWARNPSTAILSNDSILTHSVNDSILSFGVNQIYSLKVKYLDSLGGCVGVPTDIPVRYGRKIEPKIDLDSSLRFASITPADFTFGNASVLTPPKPNSLYKWDFGQGLTRDQYGPASVSTTYSEAKKNGENYIISLTAFDSLYISADAIGKICSNTDTISVFVQNLLPSLVTANGDGFNDNFYVKGMRENSFTMKLYNRWGKLIAEQDPFKVDLTDESKGGLNVDDIGPGIYYYILTEKRSGKNLVSWLTITKSK